MGGTCILSICAFCYMWHWFGVTWYSIYLLSIGCWKRGTCILSICAFCYMWNLFGVMVFHRSIMNWRCGGRCILSICVFCSLWKLFGVTVFHRFIVNWSGGYMYPQYIWILLYVTLICCNSIPYIYCQLVCGKEVYMYPQYMCILPYVKLIWCNGIP